jgi:hypothetical protein
MYTLGGLMATALVAHGLVTPLASRSPIDITASRVDDNVINEKNNNVNNQVSRGEEIVGDRLVKK